MIKGLLLKEWIKTRYMLLALLLLSLAATVYDLLTIQRVVTLRGVTHLWEILLTKDVVFLSVLKYSPVISGVILALMQFVPEMSRKRLKLTLHLPLPQEVISVVMLIYGMGFLILLFLLQNLGLFLYLSDILAPELVSHILVTSAPWFLSGLMAYGVSALVVLEPQNTRRTVYLLAGYGLIRLFFVTTVPRAYTDMLLPLLVFVVVMCFSALLSINRFKKGIQ